MTTIIPDVGFVARLITQNSSTVGIYRIENRNSVMVIPTVVSSGTVKFYGSADYESDNPAHVADPTLATWVPLPSTTFLGGEVAAGSTVTPVAARAILLPFAGFTHFRIVEQNTGTVTVIVRGMGTPVSDILAAVAAAIGVDTELPAAAALADATANPTAPAVAAFMMGWNGSTWDRVTANTLAMMVQQRLKTVVVTPTLDTSAYANGDVLFTAEVTPALLGINDGSGYIVGVRVVDKDDQTLYDWDLLAFDANVSLGTRNSAPSISDTDILNYLGRVPFTGSTDGWDYGAGKIYEAVAGHAGLPMPIKAVAGAQTIYLAGRIVTGTPTHTSSGMSIKLFVLQGASG